MIKKCSRCKAFKELDTSNFRFIETQQRYSSYCKACEARYNREYRAKQRKSHLEKLWMTVSKNFSEKEVDAFLNNLKKIWNKEHE